MDSISYRHVFGNVFFSVRIINSKHLWCQYLKTVLKLSLKAQNKNFFEKSIARKVTNESWLGNIDSRSNHWFIFISLFFLPMAQEVFHVLLFRMTQSFTWQFHGDIQMKTHNSASTSLFGHQSLEGITVWIRSFLKLWELNSCSKPIIKNERNSWTGSKGSDIDNRWCIVVGEFLILFVLLLLFASTQISMIFQSCSLSYLDQSQSFISLWVPCW